MAFIIGYNKSIHDIYIYNSPSGPTIDPSNYANNVSVQGISYNNSLYIKDPIYGFSFDVDFSGLNLRTRGAPSYGFDTYAGHAPSGVTIDPITQAIKYPYAINFFNAGYELNTENNIANKECYYPLGCTSSDGSLKASNYNYWNNGQPQFVLISPKHLIVTAHFINPSGSFNFVFLGNNNVTYNKSGICKILCNGSGSFTNPIGYTWPNSTVDWAIIELNTELSEVEQENIKIYKFLNIYGLDNTIPAFYITPQGVVVVQQSIDRQHYFDSEEYPNAAYMGRIDPDTGSPLYSTSFVWVGDSGSPQLCYVPRLNETCFLSLINGGGGVYDQYSGSENPTPGPSLQWFNAIKEYIFNNTDNNYEIEIVNYSETPPPPPPVPPTPSFPETLIINGKTFIRERILEADGQFTTGNNVTITNTFGIPGTTIDFAVVSYNQYGISEPAVIENIYVP